MKMWNICAILFALTAPQAIAQVESVTSFSPNTPYNWGALQTFAAITATSYNGNTISTGTGTLTLNAGTIFIDSSLTGGIKFGLNIGAIGSEGAAYGLNACAGGCAGGNQIGGQSSFFQNNSAAGSSATWGNDNWKFYTGTQSVTGEGAGACKNLVNGGNSVCIGAGAGLNWINLNGPSNSNWIIGDTTFQGATGQTSVGTLARNIIAGNFVANAATTSGGANVTDNLFICNSCAPSFHNGTHNGIIGTYTSSMDLAAGSNNTFNVENILLMSNTATPATSTLKVAGLLQVPNLPTTCSGQPTGSIAAVSTVLTLCP